VAVPDGASFDFDSSSFDKNHDPVAPVEEFERHKKVVKEEEVPLQYGMSYGGTNWWSMTLNELRVACKDRGLTNLVTDAELQFRFQPILGYEHMTHAELKAIWVQEGLPFSGSKTELLHTLIYLRTLILRSFLMMIRPSFLMF
jgi:hypothetical protein